MKKKFVSALLGILSLVVILVLSSCWFDVSAEIYLRDIYYDFDFNLAFNRTINAC